MNYQPAPIDYINPFVLATIHVFRTAVRLELTRGEVFRADLRSTKREVTGIIGLSGQASGSVILEMTRDVAIKATGRLLGETPNSVTSDVVDAVGELTNMIAGNAKAKIEELSMRMSLPNVILGCEKVISFPTNVPRIGIPFDSEWGQIFIEVTLAQTGPGKRGQPRIMYDETKALRAPTIAFRRSRPHD